jgi:signal transduction histidine kinase
VIAAQPLPGAGGHAWAAFKLVSPPGVARRRGSVLALAAVSLLLVLTSLHALLEAQGAQAALERELAHRERLAALGRVVAGVAHEVRNPLSAIKLRVELALDADDLGPRHTRELAVASEEIGRLDRLVADLLLVAGKSAGARSPVDLGELAARRAMLLEPWAAERGVQLVAGGSAPAEVDVDAVGRLVDNLLRNAVEASPVGARVEVCASSEGGSSLLSVLDEGDGVPDHHREELFEPFFTTKARGTGLGLPISRAVAAAHGGALAYRREGDRTCFSATFPAAPSPA